MAVKKKTAKVRHKLFHEFIGVIIFALGIFTGISIYSESAGLVGNFTDGLFFGLFGIAAYVIPLLMVVAAIIIIAAVERKVHIGKIITYIMTIISIVSVIHVFSLHKLVMDKGFIEYIKSSYDLGSMHSEGGGFFGALLVYPANLLLGRLGAYILFFTTILICIMVITNLSLKKVGKGIGQAGKSTVDKIKTGIEERRFEKERKKKLFIDAIEEEDYEDIKESHRPVVVPRQEILKPNVKNADIYQREAQKEPHKYTHTDSYETEDYEPEPHNRFYRTTKNPPEVRKIKPVEIEKETGKNCGAYPGCG